MSTIKNSIHAIVHSDSANTRKIAYLAGFAAVIIISVSTLTTAITFGGPEGYTYSMLNHNISALGEPNRSQWAAFFNWGLGIGGILLVIFMICLGLYVRNWYMILVTIPGAITAIGVAFIAVYPLSQPFHHKLVATVVFVGGCVTFVIFTLAILVVDQKKLARWLALPSLVALLAFALFLLLPPFRHGLSFHVLFAGPPGHKRPFLWWPSLLEWLIYFTVLIWVLIICGYLYRQEIREQKAALLQPLPKSAAIAQQSE